MRYDCLWLYGGSTPDTDMLYDTSGYFIVTETINEATNTSTIATACYYQTYSHSGSGLNTNANARMGVTVNGETKYVYGTALYKSDSTKRNKYLGTIYHYNVPHDPDGRGTCSWKGSSTQYISPSAQTVSTSTKTYTLTTINRYANVTTFNVSNPSGANGFTKLDLSWTTDVNISSIVYALSTDGGNNWSSWTGMSGSGTSGSFQITGLNPNTTYTIKLSVQRSDSGMWNEGSGGNKNITTFNIASITNSSVNFDVDSGFVNGITYTNPSGADVDLYITDSSDNVIVTRESYISGTAISFSSGEKTDLFAESPNSSTFSIKVKLRTNDNDSYINTKTGTATISNANPIFTNFAYEDINAVTLELTGDNKSIIKGYSNLKAIITTANKAIAQKGAMIVKYRLVVGEKQVDVDYSDDLTVELILNAIDNNVFMIYAIDSRQNSTVVQQSPETYFAYSKPTLNPIIIQRVTPIDTHAILSFEGDFFNIDFGSQSNTITAIYRYRVSDSDIWEIGETEITPTIDEDSYSFEDEIVGDLGALGFSSDKSFVIEVTIADKLTSNTLDDETLGSGEPNIAYHKNGIAVKMPYDETIEENSFQIGTDNIYIKKSENLIKLLDLIHPVGDIVFNTTGTNPSTYLGGTWIAWGTGRVPVGLDTSQTEFNTVEKTGGSSTHTLTEAQIPSHRHGLTEGYTDGTKDGYGAVRANIRVDEDASWTGYSGGGQAHNNLQPYITCYMWKRTA